MIRGVKRTIVMTALFFAVMAPVAVAGEHDGGEGLWGETNDQVVTYAGFILIVGFPILILILTLIQQRLERRKDRRLAAAKARKARVDERGGG
jgi:membrane protease YdiL (CAAX protease family)